MTWTLKRFFSYTAQLLFLGAFFIVLALVVDLLNKSGLRDQLALWIDSQGTFAIIYFIIIGTVLYSFAVPGNFIGAMAAVCIFWILRGHCRGNRAF